MTHPDDALFERFAIGALDLDSDAEADFITHVGGCAACSAKLQREATLELELLEVRAADVAGRVERPVAAVPVEPPRPATRLSRLRRPAVAAGFAVLLVAAALALYVKGAHVLGPPAVGSASAVRVVNCPDGPQQHGCIAWAHIAGHPIEYPRDPELLRFGSGPGLSVSVSLVGTPNPPIAGIEQAVRELAEPIQQCIDKELGAARATSMAFFNFTSVIEAGGEVSTLSHVRSALKTRDTGETPPIVDQVMPCISAAMKKQSFASNGARTLIEIAVRYVWRS